MAAAESMGPIAARIEAHVRAGCDLLLACSPAIVDESIAAARAHVPCAQARLATLQGALAPTWRALADNPQRELFIARLAALDTETTT